MRKLTLEEVMEVQQQLSEEIADLINEFLGDNFDQESNIKIMSVALPRIIASHSSASFEKLDGQFHFIDRMADFAKKLLLKLADGAKQ